MIIEIFLILLFISIILIFVAKTLKQPPLALAGFLFLFILGLVLVLGGLQYVAGETENYGYVCACCQNGTYTEGNPITLYECTGTPPSCDTYDLNQAACINANCTYNVTTDLCSGTPLTCNSYLNERDCEAITCVWEPSQTQPGTCENSSLTLKNTTLTKVYSNYDSEIIQGIQVNHIYGFFLCIIAIAGFIITLTNLDAFEQKDAYEQYRRGG